MHHVRRHISQSREGDEPAAARAEALIPRLEIVEMAEASIDAE